MLTFVASCPASENLGPREHLVTNSVKPSGKPSLYEKSHISCQNAKFNQGVNDPLQQDETLANAVQMRWAD